MSERGLTLTRRKFMVAGSAALATPLLLNGAIGAKPAEAKSGVTNARKGKGTMIYFIGSGCIGCQVCRTFCPAGAIHFGDTGNEIDQDMCEHCGTCFEECPISVVTETEF